MKNTMAMIMEAVSGLKEVLLHIIGLGVLVQLIFVGGFLGMDRRVLRYGHYWESNWFSESYK